jgi:hypothetical protein
MPPEASPPNKLPKQLARTRQSLLLCSFQRAARPVPPPPSPHHKNDLNTDTADNFPVAKPEKANYGTWNCREKAKVINAAGSEPDTKESRSQYQNNAASHPRHA